MKGLGINAFSGDPRFGPPRKQLRQATRRLGIRHVRLLFVWSDAVQPYPGAPIDFSFYDEIVKSIPRRVKATVVLYGAPSWMSNKNNWINGSAGETFAKGWVAPVAERYKNRKQIVAWQIWNEPNMPSGPWNNTMEVLHSPANYVDMLSHSYQIVKNISPRKRVVMAATTAINQNFPSTLNYNKALKSLGAEDVADVWAIHVYGTHLESFFLPGGVSDFMKTVERPVWVTESGARGVSNQLKYTRRMWPFIRSQIPGIKRIYYYNFAEDLPPEDTWSLINLNSENRTSDLYRYLRNKRHNR